MNRHKRHIALCLMAMVSLLSSESSLAGRYVDGGDGAIEDTGTGLVWQQADDGERRPWIDAESYCDGLSFADHDDWRLPRIDELKSIIDYTRFRPALDPAFSGHSDSYWASTSGEEGFHDDLAWGVNFWSGHGGAGGKRDPLYVRCVRKGPFWPLDISEYLVVDSATTVKDTYHQLVWQRGNEANMTRGYGWDDAKRYCEKLETGGYSDWRLPELQELETIIDYTITRSPAWNTDIFNVRPGRGWLFWTNTDYAMDPDAMWGVQFGNGGTLSLDKPGNYHVRCVRGGTPEPAGLLTIIKTGEGSGTVTSIPRGILCGTDCTEEYTEGRTVRLKARPDPGWQFNGWNGGGCAGAELECRVTMSGDTTIKADFSTRTHSLSGVVTTPDGSPIESVKVTLGGAASREMYTAQDGSYRFLDLLEGVYTVTPSKPGYFFTPASRSVNLWRANVKGKSFRAVVCSTGNGATTSCSGTGSGESSRKLVD